MNSREILKILSPCGLNCGKCQAFAEGDIKKHAQELKRLLGSFDGYAERFSKFQSVYKNYPQFKEMLDHFSEMNCEGCRQGDCKYPNCGVAACYKQKGVDFCFQCNEFPCEKTNFDPNLKQRWLKMNARMKEIGVETYFEETKDLPRYV
ncbi:MAG: CGCAxxGCC family protein [Nitrospirae bacterium]|nr:MAG: CGCAxxGCC family protein [Nitrospirota bacterium]